MALAIYAIVYTIPQSCVTSLTNTNTTAVTANTFFILKNLNQMYKTRPSELNQNFRFLKGLSTLVYIQNHSQGAIF